MRLRTPLVSAVIVTALLLGGCGGDGDDTAGDTTTTTTTEAADESTTTAAEDTTSSEPDETTTTAAPTTEEDATTTTAGGGDGESDGGDLDAFCTAYTTLEEGDEDLFEDLQSVDELLAAYDTALPLARTARDAAPDATARADMDTVIGGIETALDRVRNEATTVDDALDIFLEVFFNEEQIAVGDRVEAYYEASCPQAD